MAALIVAPMFFNVFSSRVFEPDKISLVRSIALVMLLAWLIKLANGGYAWLPAHRNAESNGRSEKMGLSTIFTKPIFPTRGLAHPRLSDQHKASALRALSVGLALINVSKEPTHSSVM